jgi:serine protease Do
VLRRLIQVFGVGAALSTAALLALPIGCSPANNQAGSHATSNRSEQAARAPVVQVPDFIALVKKVGPTVVNISTTRTVMEEDSESPGITEEDPFHDFFRRFVPPTGPHEFQARILGSGFVITEDGYILTNSHVAAGSEEVIVKLTDRREFKAKVVGVDRRTDVALIKIDARGLPNVTVGEPSKLEVGEWVAAIGSPFGFENSVIVGIVSAKGRSLPDEDYVPFIQTDVALNPGSSGGPLFNLNGEVVGINSVIYTGTGGYMGLSFAIPIDIAMEVSNQLRTHGRVIRGRLGVQIQELTPELAESFGLKNANGALVAGVEKGGPAEKAGVRPGDVILKFGGKSVQNAQDLRRLVAGTQPGASVPVELWSRGQTRQLAVTIGEVESDMSRTPGQEAKPPTGPGGLVLSELTRDQRKRLHVDHGLLVRGARGPALRAGVQPGDVILAINDIPVTGIKMFNAELAANAGRMIALLVKRGEMNLFLTLKLDGD